MTAILDKYMKGTFQKTDENIATSTITSQDSTTLIQDEIRSLLRDLKDEATTSREELTKGLRDLGQQILQEITIDRVKMRTSLLMPTPQ